MKLRIGAELALPLEAASQTFAILAMKGMGKTYLASVMAEEMLRAKLPVVVIDPLGAWWGLRASADGKQPGYPVTILGGDHGDVPLEVGGGEMVADLVVGERVSVVLDVSTFRKGERIRFMVDFCERLFDKNREPVHLFLDEADMFAPQRVVKGMNAERLLGAVEDLVRRGRIKGIGTTLITQRPAVLNKNVLEQAGCLIVFRMVGPHDRAAIDTWVEAHGTEEQLRKLLETLPTMPRGTAWFWSPGLDLFKQARVRERETFDSSKAPEIGQRVRSPARLAEIDLEVLRKRMAATVARAKENDPKELRQRIAKLECELATSKKASLSAAPLNERPAIRDAQIKRMESHFEKIIREAERHGKAMALFWRNQDDGAKALLGALRAVAPRGSAIAATATPVRRLERTVPPPSNGDASLRSGERRMLQTLAQRHPLRLTRAQLGTLAGFAASGGTFSTYFGTLKRLGYLCQRGEEVEITVGGLEYLGDDVAEAPRTTQELQALWRARLRSGEAKMLDVLCLAYPNALTKEQLGSATGFTHAGGTFSTYLGTLRRNGLVDTDRDGVRASDSLFLRERA